MIGLSEEARVDLIGSCYGHSRCCWSSVDQIDTNANKVMEAVESYWRDSRPQSLSSGLESVSIVKERFGSRSEICLRKRSYWPEIPL